MLVFSLLLLVIIHCVIFYRVYKLMPLGELNYRARGKDKATHNLFKVAAQQKQADMLLWIIATAAVFGVIVQAKTINQNYLLGMTLVLSFGLFWLPSPKVDGFIYKYVAWCSSYMAKLLIHVRPLLSRLLGLMPRSWTNERQYKIYDKDHLIELIKSQSTQDNIRLTKEQVEVAVNALTFGDKKVLDVMTPHRKLRFVKQNEKIGPMLMDELHKTGQSIFLVITKDSKASEPEVCGWLALSDIIANPDKNEVSEIISRGKHKVNEQLSLSDCLSEFVKAKTNIFMVTNEYEEIVGAIGIEQILSQIIGFKLADEFIQN